MLVLLVLLLSFQQWENYVERNGDCLIAWCGLQHLNFIISIVWYTSSSNYDILAYKHKTSYIHVAAGNIHDTHYLFKFDFYFKNAQDVGCPNLCRALHHSDPINAAWKFLCRGAGWIHGVPSVRNSQWVMCCPYRIKLGCNVPETYINLA